MNHAVPHLLLLLSKQRNLCLEREPPRAFQTVPDDVLYQAADCLNYIQVKQFHSFFLHKNMFFFHEHRDIHASSKSIT